MIHLSRLGPFLPLIFQMTHHGHPLCPFQFSTLTKAMIISQKCISALFPYWDSLEFIIIGASNLNSFGGIFSEATTVLGIKYMFNKWWLLLIKWINEWAVRSNWQEDWSLASPLFKTKLFSSNHQLFLCSCSRKIISDPELHFVQHGVCVCAHVCVCVCVCVFG